MTPKPKHTATETALEIGAPIAFYAVDQQLVNTQHSKILNLLEACKKAQSAINKLHQFYPENLTPYLIDAVETLRLTIAKAETK